AGPPPRSRSPGPAASAEAARAPDAEAPAPPLARWGRPRILPPVREAMRAGQEPSVLAPVRTGPGAGARFAAAAWLAAALVPAAALALYFAPVLFGPHSILVGDNLTHSLPLDRLLADALAGDGLRFWNEAASFGAPLHAEATTGWFHPWKLLLFAALPWLAAHDLVYVTSFLLTGLAVLLVGARVGLPPGLALAGALAAAFSPTVLGNVYNEAYALALAWCALALAAFETWYP